MTSVRSWSRTAVAILALATAVGCSSDSGDGGPKPGGLDRVDEAPSLKPLTLAPTPLWTGAVAFPDFHPDSVGLHGDAAVLASQNRLVVADLANGRQRWAYKKNEPLRGGAGATFQDYADEPVLADPPPPPVVGRDGDWSVLGLYEHRFCPWAPDCTPEQRDKTDEFGLAALSGRDGTIRWKFPFVPTRSKREGATVTLNEQYPLRADDRTAAIGYKRDGVVRMAAVDAATGAKLWETDAVRPAAIAGDVVLAYRVVPNSDDPGPVVAFDRTTGQQRWEAQGRPLKSPTLQVVNGAVLIPIDDGPQRQHAVVVDTRTGERVADLDPDGGMLSLNCVGDRETLLACTVMRPDGDLLTSFRTDERKARVSTKAVPGYQKPEGAWRGMVFLADIHAKGDKPIAVDRSANPLGAALPGVPLAVSDQHVVFDVGGATGIAVYRRSP
ncbi:putative pyrroloquinoline-quinone binding quinoprotein [Herbihabitans rhizosphaerae]|uniref:Putative pyrroloquinoline-quinone binding quinoprotein n=1 Tax=Herbihabitans rhizosphaerae TaxID=1872711 RepID=A0A4Q7L7F0_9PSEU|nr:PQQ-binding-like beta-propeller repeat protein [Herbihabitans rhizosphaerae]RZS44820.1 putative pyrroloquinoline-quinone binding quinoprotein [Herbihabitans rhizosphaerae]